MLFFGWIFKIGKEWHVQKLFPCKNTYIYIPYYVLMYLLAITTSVLHFKYAV